MIHLARGLFLEGPINSVFIQNEGFNSVENYKIKLAAKEIKWSG